MRKYQNPNNYLKKLGNFEFDENIMGDNHTSKFFGDKQLMPEDKARYFRHNNRESINSFIKEVKEKFGMN